MKTLRLIIVCIIALSPLGMVKAQHVMYANLKDLCARKGDTVSVGLKVEKRTKKQIYLMGGADYRIFADDNDGLCKYLKRRCYAVQIDTALYLNCSKVRYQRYRLGRYYAAALYAGGKLFFCAQPVGQLASSTFQERDAQRLRGEVGDAISASGFVTERVYYELNLETGKATFVGKERMRELLHNRPEQLSLLEKETGEDAAVIGRYLRQL